MQEFQKKLHRLDLSVMAGTIVGVVMFSFLFLSTVIGFIAAGMWGLAIPVGLFLLCVDWIFISMLLKFIKGRKYYEEQIKLYPEEDIFDQVQHRLIFCPQDKAGKYLDLFVTERYVVYCGQFIALRQDVTDVHVARFRNHVRFHFTTRAGRKTTCVLQWGPYMNVRKLTQTLKQTIGC